jgi:hypothetical protein
MAIDKTKQIDIDTIGKLVAMCLSVVFVVFSLWYIGARRFSDAGYREMAYLNAFFIVLAGPIAYFFVNAATDKIKLSTGLGKIVLGGGYAVAVAALLLPRMIPDEQVWRCLTIKDGGAFTVVQPVDERPPGSVFPIMVDEEAGKHKFMCRFGAGEPEVTVEFKVNDGFGVRPCTATVPRAGDEFGDIELACADVDHVE